MSSLKVSSVNLNSSENTKISIATNDLDLLLSANGKNGITVDSNGRVGIGTTSPLNKLELVTTGTGGSIVNRAEGVSQIVSERYSTDATSAIFTGRKYRGTIDTPANVASGDAMGIARYQAYGGTTVRTLAEIGAYVETYVSDVNISSYLTFSTSPAGSVAATERMRIDSNGKVGINITTPTANLHVFGNAFVTSTISDSKGDVRDIPINNQIVPYQILVTDAGKTVSTNTTIFVPNATFTAGQVVSVFNNSAASITVTQNSSVTMYLAGTATTGNRTLAQRGIATVLCVAANTFVISGAGLT